MGAMDAVEVPNAQHCPTVVGRNFIEFAKHAHGSCRFGG
jgi:hypothetical protein